MKLEKRRFCAFIGTVLCAALFVTPRAEAQIDGPPTPEDRIAAHTEIERVYHNLRKAHALSQGAPSFPAFEVAVPAALIQRKAEDPVKMSAALDVFFNDPVTAADLEAESQRIADETQAPETLTKIYAALGDDPELISETFIRSLLARGRIRAKFAYDPAIHADTRAEAEGIREKLLRGGSFREVGGERYSCRVFNLRNPKASDALGEGRDSDRLLGGCVFRQVGEEEFERLLAGFPGQGVIPPVIEERDEFVIQRATVKTKRQLKVEVIRVRKQTFNAWWKEVRDSFGTELAENMTASITIAPPLPLPLSHNPGSAWTSTCVGPPELDCPTPAPSPRSVHTAVWTGAEMIVWGGCCGAPTCAGTQCRDTGGLYYPGSNSWLPTCVTDCPPGSGQDAPHGRDGHTAVWGQICGESDCTDGDDNDSDDFTDEVVPGMIVWGGNSPEFPNTNTGGRYALEDTWLPTSLVNAPTKRGEQAAVWAAQLGTKGKMIVWSGGGMGIIGTGGRYDPVEDTWLPTRFDDTTPEGRRTVVGAWAFDIPPLEGGPRMVVWGGHTVADVTKTGGQYFPDTDTWTETCVSQCPAGNQNAPAARVNHGFQDTPWTGSEVIVWGGRDEYTEVAAGFKTGGRYDPTVLQKGQWLETNKTSPFLPTPRWAHRNTWAPELGQMLVWGGRHCPDGLGSCVYPPEGGRYDPALDGWAPITTVDAPDGRHYLSQVWTGDRLIVWGGLGKVCGEANCTDGVDNDSDGFIDEMEASYFNTGSVYDPAWDFTIEQIVPDAVCGTAGGDTVFMFGSDFAVPMEVVFDVGGAEDVIPCTTTPSDPCFVQDADTLQVTVPPGATFGTVDVAVRLAGGINATGSPLPFSYADVPTISPPVTPSFGTTLGGTEVTVTGTGMLPGLNPEVIFFKVSESNTITPTEVSVDGTELKFIVPSERPPSSYSLQVKTLCGTSGTLADAFEYKNLGFSAQPFGGNSIAVLDLDTNTEVPTAIDAKVPLDIKITEVPVDTPAERRFFSLEENLTGDPLLVSRPFGNPEKVGPSFPFKSVDEVPNAIAVDPVDAGLVYVTSITKLDDPMQPAGVRVFDISSGAIVSDDSSDRIEHDLIELHNCIDDGTGHCRQRPRISVGRTYATDIEVIAVNPVEFGVSFQEEDPVTVVDDPMDCTGAFSEDDLTQRYGYATSAAGEHNGTDVIGRSRLSILDLNPCVIANINPLTKEITLVPNDDPITGTYQTEVAIFGPAGGKGAGFPEVPPEELGLTLAENAEGAFIYVLNKQADGPQYIIKIDAVTRDFAYNKRSLPDDVKGLVNVSDVAVVRRDVDGEAEWIAAIDGTTLRVFEDWGQELTYPNLPVELGAGSAPDDIAVIGVNDPDFTQIYVSLELLSGVNVIQEIVVTRPIPGLPTFTKTRQLAPSGGFEGTLKGIALDSAGDLYVCEQDFNVVLDDRVRKFTVPPPGMGNQLGFAGIETTDVVDPVDVAVDELISAPGVVAVLDLGGTGDAKGRLVLLNINTLLPTGDVLNSLKDPRDVVTEKAGVYVVAEKATDGVQTGEIRLFTQTFEGTTSKKVIRGQFGASGVAVLGDHPFPLAGSTCFDGQCPGKRYVVSDSEIGKLFQLDKPVILDTGYYPNDAVTVGSGAQQQVWVSAGEAVDTAGGEDCATTPKDYVINVFRTRDDTEFTQDPPLPEVPIDLKAELGGPFCTPTSMAVAEFPSGKKRVFVTMFDSGVVLVYDADTIPPGVQFDLVPGGQISVGAGPRRIVIQPEIVE